MSKIEVDAITEQSGTTLTTGGGAGKTVVVDATTVTLGRCGGTVALASGATQTGFGRTGTVDWNTTPKTSTFTAVSGDGFFANTESGAFTMNLPAGSAGAIVSVADYAGTWQTNNLTVTPNGTDKIGGVNSSVDLNTEGQSVTFIFVDSTQGWVNTMDSTSNVRANAFVTATGGTVATVGNCKIHTFTGPGTFCVSGIAACASQNIMSHLIVAGGASGGSNSGDGTGGGGAGGFREVKNPVTPYTASPLDGYGTPANRVTITAQAYPIVVGAGGSGRSGTPPALNCSPGFPGSDSSFGGITSAGGGKGAASTPGPTYAGGTGGSGGGSGGGSTGIAGGVGNTPPVSPAQGNAGGQGGGTSPDRGGGGGGGAGGSGTASPNSTTAGSGGAGVTTSITNSPVTRAGGGGANIYHPGATNPGPGGSGGASNGGGNSSSCNATVNTGSGSGGAANTPASSGNGGSGIVVIRYKFQ